MLSKILLFFIFLGNVDKVSSPTDKRCEWFCKTTAKIPQTADKMEVWLNISKRIDQKCAANTLYRNLKNTTTTGYVFVFTSRDYHDGFSFVQFTTTTALEHTFQTEEMNKTAMNVSCLLQPMSNQAEMAVPNGLDALNSLRFYISFDNQSRNIPFVGYVLLETNYHISVGSNGNVSKDHELTFTLFSHNFRRLIWKGYIIFFPLVLTLFCHTPHKIKSNNRRGRKPAEGDDDAECNQKKPQEHSELPIQEVNDSQQHMAQNNDLNESVTERQSPEPSARTHQSETMETVGASQRVTDPASISKMDGDYVDVVDVDEPASPLGIRSFFSKVFLNMKNTNEGKWENVCKGIVRFVILNMFPLSILLWIDGFVLGMPRLFFQGITNMPSPFLTKLVFTFAFKKYPGLFAWAFVCFILRMFFLCFISSSSTMVPSFIHRKHLICFLSTSDVCKVLFPCNLWSVCNECKKIETSEFSNTSSIPHKIQQYWQSSFCESLKRNLKDNFENLAKKSFSENQEHLPLTVEESSSPKNWKDKSGNLAKNSLLGLGKLFLFIIVTAVDCIISLPVVSLCHGGCWYTVNWFENKFVKALFLLLEFVCICFSIVWVVHILHCCSLSLQIAHESLIISFIEYPIETLSSMAIYLLTWHSIWMMYSLFTKNYFGLLTELFDICREHHSNKMKDYTIGYKIYVPKDLFDRAYKRFEPVTKNLWKLVRDISFYTILFFLLFSFVGGTKYSKKDVLPPTLTFLIFLHPRFWDLLKKRDEEKEQKGSSREGKLKNFVDAYFDGKLD